MALKRINKELLDLGRDVGGLKDRFNHANTEYSHHQAALLVQLAIICSGALFYSGLQDMQFTYFSWQATIMGPVSMDY